MTALEPRIADAYVGACMDELEAPKPGNVHIYADGHGSTVADFRRSAEVSAGSIAKTEAAVGARILGAIEATHAAVGQNTNLGIVLLCAPLARAAELRAARMSHERLRDAVARVLNDLNVQDADLAFRAISLAAPGGLGRSERHDVGEPASATLLEAMIEAAARDQIARQYATGFADIFDLGSPCLETASSTLGALPRRRRRYASTSAFSRLFPTRIFNADMASRPPSTCSAKRRPSTLSRSAVTTQPPCGLGRSSSTPA